MKATALSALFFSIADATLSFGPDSRWERIGGSTAFDVPMIRGEKGVSAAENYPGSRCGHSIFVHPTSGLMYLFGGYGYTNTSDGEFNDVWSYNFASNQWTWLSGDKDPSSGDYSSFGVMSASAAPSSRFYYAMDMHPVSGELYLFGGRAGTLFWNDFWRWDPQTTFWTWLSGSNQPNQQGYYGTLREEDVSNQPGCRQDVTLVVLPDDKVMLFGGFGLAWVQTAPAVISPGIGNLNDLWQFNIQTGLWSWISGSKLIYSPGFYGVKGIESTDNTPPARFCHLMKYSAVHKKIYVYGGWINWIQGNEELLNDLWQFDVVTLMWTWIDGVPRKNAPAVYGVQGIGSKLNMMRGICMSSIIIHPETGSLFFYGGSGISDGNVRVFTNEAWLWDPATECWTWIAGSASDSIPTFGEENIFTMTNSPGPRFRHSLAFRYETGEIIMYGGERQLERIFGDLWKLVPGQKQCPDGTNLKGDTCIVNEVTSTKLYAPDPTKDPNQPKKNPEAVQSDPLLIWLIPVAILCFCLTALCLAALLYRVAKWHYGKRGDVEYDNSTTATSVSAAPSVIDTNNSTSTCVSIVASTGVTNVSSTDQSASTLTFPSNMGLVTTPNQYMENP